MKDKKNSIIKKYKVPLLLAAFWLLLSLMGFLGRNTVYAGYSVDVRTTPYFVLVLQGIHDHIYPWSCVTAEQPWMNAAANYSQSPQKITEAQRGTDEASLISEQEGSAAEISSQEAMTKRKSFEKVGDDYFDDAVFIGDSRTAGLSMYGGLDNATFYATVGMNVYDLWTESFCELDGEKVTLEEALTARQFKKIYFQIGINEMGTGTVDSFMEAYEASVQKLRTLQPDAIIFVQGIMRVTKEKSENDRIYNNEGINARNERIAELADGEKIFYIDVNDVVCDKEGNLKADLTFDNLHLYATNYVIWVNFLKTKGIIL